MVNKISRLLQPPPLNK